MKTTKQQKRGVSQRQAAKHFGVSPPAIRQAIKSGAITPEKDGSIDLTKAAKTYMPDAARSAIAKLHAPRQTPKDDAPDQAPGADSEFTSIRRRTESAKARLVELRAKREEGQLVDRAKVLDVVFRLARQYRDGLQNWAIRTAPLLAAEVGADEHQMRVALDAAVRAFLTEQGELAEATLQL